MKKRTKKSDAEQAEKLTFRLAPEYAQRVATAAKAAGVSPNQFGRISTMASANNAYLHLSERMGRVEDLLIRMQQQIKELEF